MMKQVILVIIGVIIGFILNYPQYTNVSEKVTLNESKTKTDKTNIVNKTITKPDGTKIEVREEKRDIKVESEKQVKKEIVKEKDKGVSISIVSKNITDYKSHKDYGVIITKEVIAGVGVTGCYYLDGTLCLGISLNF